MSQMLILVAATAAAFTGAGASDWQDLTVINENSDGSFNAKQVYIPDNAIQYFTISDNTYKSDSFARRYYIKELSDSCFAGASQLTGVKITWSDNIVKKIPGQTLLDSGFKSTIVDDLEESNFEANSKKYFGDFGETLNTWRAAPNGLVDWSGYISRYERSSNFMCSSHEFQR